VLGPRFLYALCQQPSKRTLRSLNTGDIILFGSKKRKSETFMIDTVFVVGVHAPIRRDGTIPDWGSDLYRRITIDLIENQIPECGLRLYGGEAWSSEKPFSFVPCRPTEPQPIGFPRPEINPIGPLASLISPGLRQGCNITSVTPEHARAAWGAVVRQVLDWDCGLGTAIKGPDVAFTASRS